MEKKRILVLVGGISKNSLNKKLFMAMKEEAPSEMKLEYFDISELPFFSQDIENEPPQQVVEFKKLIAECFGVLFITPEYNRSLPGVLKNAIDWGSRPYGKNLWDKLPAGVMGCSIGATGTMASQQHLRQILGYLNMAVMGQPEFYLNGSKVFDQEGQLTDQKTKDHIQKYWEAFTEWIDTHAAKEGVIKSFIKDQSSGASLSH